MLVVKKKQTQNTLLNNKAICERQETWKGFCSMPLDWWPWQEQTLGQPYFMSTAWLPQVRVDAQCSSSVALEGEKPFNTTEPYTHHGGSWSFMRNVLRADFWPTLSQALIETGTLRHSAGCNGFCSLLCIWLLCIFSTKLLATSSSERFSCDLKRLENRKGHSFSP